jgi:hypothetical protein
LNYPINFCFNHGFSRNNGVGQEQITVLEPDRRARRWWDTGRANARLEQARRRYPGLADLLAGHNKVLVRRRPDVGPQNKRVTRVRPGLNRAKSRGNDEQEAHRGRRDEYSLHDVHGSPLTPTITIRPKAHDVCKKDLID